MCVEVSGMRTVYVCVEVSGMRTVYVCGGIRYEDCVCVWRYQV